MALPEKWWRDNTSCVDAAVSTRLDQVVNYSRTTTIYEGEAPFIKSLELRLERAFGLQRAYGGKWCAQQAWARLHPPNMACLPLSRSRVVTEKHCVARRDFTKLPENAAEMPYTDCVSAVRNTSSNFS